MSIHVQDRRSIAGKAAKTNLIDFLDTTGYCLTCRFGGVDGMRCETSSFGMTESKGYACRECTYSETGFRSCSLSGTCPC
jgi:hypothetical protein